MTPWYVSTWNTRKQKLSNCFLLELLIKKPPFRAVFLFGFRRRRPWAGMDCHAMMWLSMTNKNNELNVYLDEAGTGSRPVCLDV